MTVYSNENYDPGFLNSPGKGQSSTNPLAPVYMESLGVVKDLSAYGNMFAGGTINADVGFTLGLENFLSKDGFKVSTPGMFGSNVDFQENVTINMNADVGGNLGVGGSIIMRGARFRPKIIRTISGPHLVLAAY